uniref:Uncharacterized protein n=1 Tax=Ananas comosus var. bracteatus TaxID=296719 RepID=A0A6V7NJV7_ANACO|nr:unnamed protein product [Ananas comosus var. bracteatus]
MMEDSFNIPQSNLRSNWMVDEEDNLESMPSFFEEELEPSCNSMSSSSSDEDGDATSSNSSSTDDKFEQGSPLFEMSSLLAQLPIKRGLSKHFQGKSQSFTSLSSVRCLEDLIKPEKLHKKQKQKQKLKPSKSSNTIAKKSSRSTFSTLGLRRRSFLSRSTSIAPQRQGSSVSNHTLLFA